jgi:S-(hydroxymethyl)glutathione dehydrogenase/alcohol dehydrogenase
MKAAVLHEIGTPLVIEDIAIDKPAPREVLIRTGAVGVCHSDLHFINGTYTLPPPFVPGHEAAGVVEAVGSEVRGVKPGDHVVTCLSAFCGHCEHCLTGNMAICLSPETRRAPDVRGRLGTAEKPITQLVGLAAFAEQMLVHENALVAIDPEMPLDRAALIGCAVVTGVGAVVHTSHVRPGDTVAVVGCGGIGLAAINGAAIAGAGRIIAVDRLAEKLALAKAFGATDTVDASAGDPVEQVLELTGGGVQHAIEAIGLKVTVEQTFRMIRRGGAATIIGMVPPNEFAEINVRDLLFGRKLLGCYMGSNHFPVDMPRYVDFYKRGLLKLDQLISRRIPLEKVNEAFAELETGRVARSVVVFDR